MGAGPEFFVSLLGPVLGIMLLALLVAGFIALYTLAAVYAERKVSAFIQDRVGPLETGPRGLLQTVADILKLLLKEDIVPRMADKPLWVAAPFVVFAAVFVGYAVIPFGPEFVGANLNVGVLFLTAFTAFEVAGLLMAGWGSNNKYALYGAVRSVAQVISYEIPAGLAVLSVVLVAGTLNLNEIVLQQGPGSPVPRHLLGLPFLPDVSAVGGFLTWNVLAYPHLVIAFVIYFIASLAEVNRAPFDIPEAESELVAGYHTEYGGIKFAFFFLAEYGGMLLVGLIGAVLFLGGWQSPLPNVGAVALADWTTGPFWGAFWLLAKALAVVLVHMWVRWTLPRLRVDQLMYLCWKVLTPFAVAMVVVSALWATWMG
ncbi:MAG: complex I subunit 1 family protein [Bacteroidota bacterium]|nr:NADH-quinone oxidoreductase subunit H [Bacteroidota bacterium]MDW8138381.1 complex I subunit 1 family protein [Bacteroidota bacterium]